MVQLRLFSIPLQISLQNFLYSSKFLASPAQNVEIHVVIYVIHVWDETGPF